MCWRVGGWAEKDDGEIQAMHAMTLSPKGYCCVRTLFTGGEEELLVIGDGSPLVVLGERCVRTGRVGYQFVDSAMRVLTDGNGREFAGAVVVSP